MSAFENAKKFFEACEAPKGWDGCKDYVADGATFSCQASALADVKTVQAYCDWMKGLVDGPLPDGRYTLHSSAWDEAKQRRHVCRHLPCHAQGRRRADRADQQGNQHRLCLLCEDERRWQGHGYDQDLE